MTEIVPGKVHPIEVGSSECREAFLTLSTLIAVSIELDQGAGRTGNTTLPTPPSEVTKIGPAFWQA